MKNVHFAYNFLTVRHRAFILNKCVLYGNTFSVGLLILFTWPWPWPLEKFNFTHYYVHLKNINSANNFPTITHRAFIFNIGLHVLLLYPLLLCYHAHYIRHRNVPAGATCIPLNAFYILAWELYAFIGSLEFKASERSKNLIIKHEYGIGANIKHSHCRYSNVLVVQFPNEEIQQSLWEPGDRTRTYKQRDWDIMANNVYG